MILVYSGGMSGTARCQQPYVMASFISYNSPKMRFLVTSLCRWRKWYSGKVGGSSKFSQEGNKPQSHASYGWFGVCVFSTRPCWCQWTQQHILGLEILNSQTVSKMKRNRTLPVSSKTRESKPSWMICNHLPPTDSKGSLKNQDIPGRQCSN